MFFDLQFSQDKFVALLRDQVERALPVVTSEFDDPLGGADKLAVDHLDVAEVTVDTEDPTSDRTFTIAGPGGAVAISTKPVQLKIVVDTATTTRAKVIAAGHLGTPETKVYKLWVFVEVSAKASAGSLVLELEPVDVDFPIKGQLSDVARQQLLAKMPKVQRTIAFPDIAGQTLTATNAGLAFNGEAIAIRAELTPPGPGTVQAWKSFYAGSFATRSGDWSILLPKELLVDVVDDALTGAIDALPAKDSKIEVVSEPVTTWTVLGAVSKATINSVDACPVGNSDIEVDLKFTVLFGLASGDLQVTIDTSWDLDDGDVARCAAAMVLLPGSVVTALVGAITGPVGAIVSGVLTVIGSFVAVVVISDKAHGMLGEGIGDVDPGDMGLHTIAQDDDHAIIQGHVALGGLMDGMTATAVLPTPDGLVLSGTLAVPPSKKRGLHALGQMPFAWTGGYSCSKQQWAPDPQDATLALDDPSGYPVAAQVELLTAPAADYAATVSSLAPLDAFEISVHSNVAAGGGPDCELLVFTNAGLRYANLGHLPPKPPPPSALELAKMKGECFKQILPGVKKWLQAHWLIDPPPYERLIEHLHVWEAVVSRVAAGTQLELAVVDAREQARVVATLPADARGTASFRVATAAGESIAISARAGLDQATLAVTGALLECVARFRPRVAARDATIVGTGDHARVLIATGNQVVLLGLDGSLAGVHAVPDVQHVAAIGKRLMVHAGARLQLLHLPLSGVLRHAATWQPAQEIQHLEQRGTALAVTLRDGTVAMLDRDLRPVARTVRATASWLAERWMKAPMRAGTLVARIEHGAVAVYRCARTSVF